MFELCDPELFPETLQTSEVTSCSNGCYEENSSYATNISLALDIENKFNSNNYPATTPTTTTVSTTATSTTTTNNSSNLSIIFDSPKEIDNDISASIDFSLFPSFSVHEFLQTQQDQFDFSAVQPQISITSGSVVEGLSQYPTNSVGHFVGAPLPSVFEEDCMSSVPSYVPLNPSSPSCSFLSPTMGAYMTPGAINTALSADSAGIFGGSLLLRSELQPQEMEYQGENGGIYSADSMQRVFNPPDLQALSTDSQQLVAGAGSSAPLTSEMSNLEDSTFKVGKLSVEQRKEKIHRYMKKRNERNFSKKIKYACRKTLADSRPRVRGRFAKNDDYGENHGHRSACSNHEDDDEEVLVKEEDDMVDSSDIFAHISGVNSFKCNYPIQSWI
ncbi:CCT motif protein [Quillaja saponaria]|uniref:CCT motif protein n=1 Tax=Quillaja saponaria TaxID=32244 RepID=A0AAD7LDN0_QUISA|nr:CCT motif protein [Quillaja saponaria]